MRDIQVQLAALPEQPDSDILQLRAEDSLSLSKPEKIVLVLPLERGLVFPPPAVVAMGMMGC